MQFSNKMFFIPKKAWMH